MHAHVDYLRNRADYIYLPVYLEESQEDKVNKQYCYYTQFVSSVILAQKRFYPADKILTPLLKSVQGEFSARLELYKMLRSIGLKNENIIPYLKFRKKRTPAHNLL
jgi:hypothetical protein